MQVGDVDVGGGWFWVGQSRLVPGMLSPLRWAGGTRTLTVPEIVDPAMALGKGTFVDDPTNPYAEYAMWSPANRRCFVEWLAGSRPGNAPEPIVRLYFYGLERHLTTERLTVAETESLLREVRRLRSEACPEYRALRQACDALSTYVACRSVARRPAALSSWRPSQLDNRTDIEEVATFVFALRRKSADAVVDSELAAATFLSAYTWPSSRASWIADSARPELFGLLHAELHKIYPDGLVLPGSSMSWPYHQWYQPLSPALAPTDAVPKSAGTVHHPRSIDWSQVSAIAGPLIEDLEPYARFKSRKRSADSLEGLLALPERARSAAQRLRIEAARVQLGAIAAPVGSLSFERVAAMTIGTDVPRDLAHFRQLHLVTRNLGFGIEPDPEVDRFEAKAQSDVWIFRDSEPDEADRRNLDTATAYLRLFGQFPSLNDIGARFEIPANQQPRLAARADRFECETRTNKRMATVLDSLPEDARQRLGDVAAALAALSGDLSPARTDRLERLFNAIGRDRERLFATLHRGSSQTKKNDRISESVPYEMASSQPHFRDGLLDMAQVASIRSESDRAAMALAAVFEEEPDVAPSRSELHPSREDFSGEPIAALIVELAARERWKPADVREICARFHLLPGQAGEALNELAYDEVDEPLLVDDDGWVVDVDIASRLITLLDTAEAERS